MKTAVLMMMIALGTAPGGLAGVLYYGGDPDSAFLGLVSGGNSYTPQDIFTVTIANVYDDFVVPAGGWTITGLGGHFATASPVVPWLRYEIRSGVSEGVGGTLISSGFDIASITPDGFDFGQPGYYLELTFPSLNYNPIELGEGTYWLSLFWVNYIGIREVNSIPVVRLTAGDNRVNGPFANGSYWDAPDFGIDFHDPAADLGIANADFSYRISGSAGISSTPEPGTCLLIGTGLSFCLFVRRKSR